MGEKLLGLIYLSPLPWSSFEQRPHKFARWFRQRTGGEVLWVDPYPTRFPLLSDFKSSGVKTGSSALEQPSWLEVIQPKALPIEPIPGSGVVNRLFWHLTLQHIKEFERTHDVLVAIGKPSVLANQVLSLLPETRSFYDAMDDFPAFYSGMSRAAMAAREARLVENVNVLAVSSTALRDRWLAVRPDARLVPNGLDLDAMSGIRVTKHDECGPSRFGYVGTIGSWFDWNWVISLAESRPNDEVVLIGPQFRPCPHRVPKNIVIMPACAHLEALAAMTSFDVGLIPFLQNQLTISVDPIKYYEYRALGIPVLSTAFGEMLYRRKEPGTFLSYSADDIARLSSSALSWSFNKDDIDQFILMNSWHARFDMLGLI